MAKASTDYNAAVRAIHYKQGGRSKIDYAPTYEARTARLRELVADGMTLIDPRDVAEVQTEVEQ
jgi:hypothetical protein